MSKPKRARALRAAVAAPPSVGTGNSTASKSNGRARKRRFHGRRKPVPKVVFPPREGALTHRVKTHPPFFQDTFRGDKLFDVRPHDRDYRVGDTLVLCLFDPKTNTFIGNAEIEKRITYVLGGGRFGIKDGFCVLGLAEP